MAKYIELEDAYKTLSDYYHHSTDNQHMALREALDRVPAADVVERKTWKWEVDEVGCGICSACGNFAFETTTHHISGWYPRFCPNCGAKMEVPTDV